MEEQQNKDADNKSTAEAGDQTKVNGENVLKDSGNSPESSPTFPLNPEPHSDVTPHRLPIIQDSASGQPNAQRNAQVDIASLESEKEKDEAKDEDKEDDEKEETETDNEVATDETLGQTDLLEPMQETEEAETAEAASESGGSLFSPSTLGWSAAALAGLGLALSGGGDDDEPPLEVPTVSLDTDTGLEGDGITATGVFSVGNLESNATWEFSLDGGSSWTAGQGDSFTITDDGSYSVAVRQTRDGSNFEVSAQLSITIDTVAPEISVDDLAEIDENSGADQVVIAANPLAEEGVVYSLADGSDAALSINGDTGAVSLSTDPDHETQSSYSFTIVATDIAGNVSEQALTLGINDLDEISPSITSGAVAAAIDENSGAGQIVYTATSDDTDDTGAVGGSVTYSLTDGSDDAVSINGETGAVSLSTNPNHEAQSAYTFTVVATDAAGNTDEQAVTLGINDLDEVAPSITSGATANAIDENSGAGQIIYTATSSDSADVSGGVTYSLADGSDDALSINGETGAVSLSTNPDNETQDSYGFTVVATDAAGNASEQAVTLGINDLDESAPVITSGATAVAIDENSGAGQIVYTATSDDSADVSGGVTYSLAASSDAALSIDTATGEVTLSTDPDFETQAQFSFTVVATDVAGNAGQQPVTLDINDLDEVPPVLLSIDSSVADQTVTLTYDEALSETAIPDIADFSVRENTSELTISAVAIVGDKVILSLNEAPPSGPLQVTYTGELIQDVAGNIGPQFTQIIVSDGYLRGVEIYADDNNDGVADPDELLEGVTSNAEGEIILEGDLASSNLIITSGVNVDTGAVNEFSLSAPAGYSVVNPITTLVSSIINNSAGATSTEDAEALVIESLGLELGDGGAGLSGYDPISDQSEDALANRVVTAQVASILAVAASSGEDEAASEAAQQAVLNNLVATIETAAPLVLDSESVAELLTSADGDSLVDVELLAELGSAVDQLSEVDSLDAIVSVQAALTDKIAPDAPSLDLSDETDSGIKGDVITSQAAPTIRISFEVEAVDGTSVVVGDTVSFWNPDVTTIEGAANVEITQVDLENGFIDIAIEELSEGLTTFNSLVTDIAGNQSALAALPVRLDTTKPVITSDDFVGSVNENSGAGQAVYTVTAGDVGGGVSFSLVEGSDAALSIDATTGIVSLSTDPDFETQDDYSFTVRATDAAGNVSESLPLLLGIGNEDESQPSITSLDSSLAVEGGGEGQIVYTATSDDSGDISGGVTYTLAENSDPLLSINSLNGQVTLAANPDAEVQSEYLMTIVAADGAGFTDSKDVTILVDTGPLITSSLFSAVTENDPSNQIVYTATATNTENPDEAITFSFGTVADDRLSIDSQSGQVTLLESPNFEATPEYAFTVKATGESGKATEQLVRVEVANLDEVAPTITSGAIATAIDENSGAGQVIYTATADDSADISGGFSFSLATGSDAALSINANTGAVTLSTDPDQETQATYSFTVVATDAAGNVSEGQAVTLAVNDLDEVAPSVTSGATATAIDENSGADQVVYTATADDSADISGGFSFNLATGSDAALSIDADTGAVTLSTDPDHETQAAYSFTVIATDAAGNASEGQAVTLAVNDLDEVAPSITSGATATAIDENSGADQVIYTAAADDSADISGGVSFSLATGSDAALSIDADTGAVTLSDDPGHETQATYNFTVVATDAAGNASEGQAVTLAVNDLDEVAPSITSGATANAIDENSGANQVIYTATADDSADISGGVSFSLAQSSDAALSIDADTGAVTLSTDPDHETQATYSFTVVATDAAGNVSTDQAVTLAVNDLDEVAPTVTSGATATSIDENAGANQVIYTATADDTSDISGGVSFSLATGSDAALSIDADTGAVTLSTDPDHETQAAYSFTVIATDAAGNASEGQAVTLAVNDLDEVAPSITSGATATAIDENSGADQVIYTAAADDSADISGGVSFSLATGSDAALSIDADTGAVTLSTDPDHETQATYNFTVVATDAAGNASEGQAVTLAVNDLDEVAPSITSGATANAIDENSGANQVIYTATADDSADISGGVSFSLAQSSDAALSIDADTGAVTLSTDPDHETQATYSFTVVATDAAGNVSTDQAVTLAVNDLDEVAPTVTSGATATSIDENAGANQVIYTATADDTSDISGGVSFSLATGSDAALSIDADTGAVTLSTDPDHETQAAYSFTVIATDAAGNASEGQAVTLAVNDLDDSAPSITSGATATAIDENSGVGQVIYTATADDSADISGGVSFSLGQGSDAALSINADTGAVTLSSDPDHETQAAYSFTVIATDAAGNVGEQAVTLGINNLDEVAPSITSGATATAIDEDSGADQVIYTATADDSADISGGVSFSLAESVGASTSSVIDFEPAGAPYIFGNFAGGVATVIDNPQQISGINNSASVVQMQKFAGEVFGGSVLALPQEIDFSGSSVFTMKIFASRAVEVFFKLEGQNLSAASIERSISHTGSGWEELRFDFAGSTQPGVTAVTLIFDLGVLGDAAGDPDNWTFLVDDLVTPNGSAATLSDALSIDADTGAVTLSTDPDHETQPAYTFAVVATDAAGNVSEGQAVTLSVNDLDEAAPTITSGVFATAIDENSGADQVIYTATADDSADISGGVSFSLAEGSDAALSINSATGAVSLSSDPDHESQSSYSFTVIATDAAGNVSEGQAVTLAVNDLDDAAPTITSSGTASAIDENSGANQGVYLVTADDSADLSEGITFSLAASSDAGLSIDSETRVVFLSTNPDHETQSTYSFTVIATDAAGNASEQAVTLGINDLDEVAPTITSSAIGLVVEDSGANRVVYTATSDDTGDVSGGVTYSLADGSDDALNIDSTSGAVTLSENPNKDEQAAYSFTVIATDSVGLSSSLAVNLTVDVAPLITSSTTPSVSENIESGQVVYTVVASDSEDSDAIISYDLKEGSDQNLSIDTVTGQVTLAVAPDFENQESFVFIATASDQAGNTSEQLITLSVTNLDEVAPAITSGSVATAIDENSGAGQVIYTATADDSADISGGVSFSLATGSDAALSINSATGAVSLSADPDHETQSSYSFTVVATDAAGNASEGQAVTLSVNDLDEAAPTITSGVFATAIDENSGAGQVVYTATADDSADISGGVSFSLAEGSDGALSINSVTGAVSLSTNPDHETQPSYSFTVIATDAAGNAVEQEAKLGINDLDDLAPIFTSGTLAKVDENIGADQVIYTAVSDDSGDVSGGVTYSLADVADDELSIDSETGAVSLSENPDHEIQSSYPFTVVATDAAGNVAEQAIAVNVNDLDDSAPSITSGAVATAVDENSGANQIVYSITSDDSGDVSGGVTYSLADGSDAAMSVNSETGAVSLSSDPDQETQATYSFTVVATDAAGNASEGQAVTLAVNDLDEVAPTITSSASASVPILQTSLYQIRAEDTADISGGLTFGVKADAGDDDLVDVNSETGQVSLKSGFTDDEEKNAYTFTVLVSDGVNASTEQLVTVNVASPIAVAGPSVTRGGLTPSLTTDDDGADVLEIRLDASVVPNFNFIASFDFTMNYSADEFGAIVDSQFEFPDASVFFDPDTGERFQGVVNTSVVGQIRGAATYPGVGADAVLAKITFSQPEGVETFTVELKDVQVGGVDLSPSLYVLGDSVVVTGTSASEFFDLEGGDATVIGGVGPDVFSLTATTGSLTTINDFVSGEDTIDLSDLAEAYGYGSGVSGDASPADGALSRYAGDITSISELIAGNDDSLDNTFGAFFNNETDKLTVFMDSSTASGSTTIETFVITLPEDVSFDDSDLTAVSYSFIA